MKKLWIVALVLLVGFSFAMAQEIHEGETHISVWSFSYQFDDGTPIPPEADVTFKIFRRDADTGANTAEIGETSGLTYEVAIPRGCYALGVQSQSWYGGMTATSRIVWSDEEASVNVPVPFWLENPGSLDAPEGFGIQ